MFYLSFASNKTLLFIGVAGVSCFATHTIAQIPVQHIHSHAHSYWLIGMCVLCCCRSQYIFVVNGFCLSIGKHEHSYTCTSYWLGQPSCWITIMSGKFCSAWRKIVICTPGRELALFIFHFRCTFVPFFLCQSPVLQRWHFSHANRRQKSEAATNKLKRVIYTLSPVEVPTFDRQLLIPTEFHSKSPTKSHCAQSLICTNPMQIPIGAFPYRPTSLDRKSSGDLTVIWFCRLALAFKWKIYRADILWLFTFDSMLSSNCGLASFHCFQSPNLAVSKFSAGNTDANSPWRGLLLSPHSQLAEFAGVYVVGAGSRKLPVDFKLSSGAQGHAARVRKSQLLGTVATPSYVFYSLESVLLNYSRSKTKFMALQLPAVASNIFN